MCGRYACRVQPLGRWTSTFKVWLEGIEDNFNIAPTTSVPVFTAEGWRQMRWGLVPSWANEIKTTFSTFNARAETVTTKPAYRSAWKKGQRCLIPAAGYFEWKKVGTNKIPYFIHSVDGEPLVFAGLWDRWLNQSRELYSCTVVTCPATDALKVLHHRQPLCLSPESGALWLNGDTEAGRAILVAPPPIDVSYHPVDKKVGDCRNQGESLIEPLRMPLE